LNPPSPSLDLPTVAASALRFQSFDLLAMLVAVVHSNGAVLFANAALEDARGLSRRAIVGSAFADSFTDATALNKALQGLGGNEFAALRYDAWLKRLNRDPLPVHVIVTPTERADEIIVELLPLERAGPGQQGADSQSGA
jgi:two-component system nitrogen regulation sensor histidine kinase GlnL